MISSYGARGWAFQKKTLLMALGVVAIPFALQLHTQAASAASRTKVPTVPRDPRVTRLHRFLTKLNCPVANMSEDFVRAADDNHLDWRLLPSIAVIESGGGKAYKNNNIFGWNRGEQSFATIRSGLELVAYQLGRGPLYRRHNSLGKLRIYNEHDEYPDMVMSVMNRISPEVRLRTVSVPVQSAGMLEDAAFVRY